MSPIFLVKNSSKKNIYFWLKRFSRFLSSFFNFWGQLNWLPNTTYKMEVVELSLFRYMRGKEGRVQVWHSNGEWAPTNTTRVKRVPSKPSDAETLIEFWRRRLALDHVNAFPPLPQNHWPLPGCSHCFEREVEDFSLIPKSPLMFPKLRLCQLEPMIGRPSSSWAPIG